MSHRTQITLTDGQYRRLRDESARSGLSLAELVRRAVENAYASSGQKELMSALEGSFACWDGRDVDGEAYVERLRLGMARRLADR